MLIKLFSSAGATGHVFLLRKGRVSNKGLAYSGFIGPKTTVAVVPTTSQILNFAIDAQTKDKQNVVTSGNLTVTLSPEQAVSKFDFTVSPDNGGYKGNWEKILNAKVIERVLRAVLDTVKDLDIEDATRSQKEVEDGVTEALDSNDTFSDYGITIDSCSIPKIKPRDEEVEDSIGAKERQAMLSEADEALHDRRMNAAGNDRTLGEFESVTEREREEYEADTALGLEKKQSDLIEEQAKNKQREAEIDAKATKTRLEPMQEIEPGNLVGASIMEAAKSGRLGNLAITSEFLAALGQK